MDEINPVLAKVEPNREMPNDPMAERSVLSAMLMSEEALQYCLVEVCEDDFYQPSNRRIYHAMKELFDEGTVISQVTVADKLRSNGELELVGSYSYVMDLAGDALVIAGYANHAEILRRASTLRQMISACAQIQALAFSSPESTGEIVNEAERMLLSVTDRCVRSDYTTLSEMMMRLYESLDSEKPSDAVRTGFPGVDSRLIGMMPGQMIVVGARPGVGKTSFCLNLATNVAQSGATVALFSLEMSDEEIAQRLLSSRSGIPLADIRSGRIRDDQWTPIIEATEELGRLDVLVDDTSGTNVTEIRAKARRMLHGKDKGIVIIDYLQLMSSASKDNRATAVGEMSRGMKVMAKELGVPVVALSQLNRGVEGRPNKRPQLSDLRESGSIEQDADVVILLDRSLTQEEAQSKDRPDDGITNLIIAKNRSGPLGVVRTRFDGSTTRFYEIDEMHGEYE